MAKIRNKPDGKMWGKMKTFLTVENLKKLVFDPNHISLTCWLLLIFEVFLNVLIIERVNYTEIDWIAYMQEVEGFLNGTLDYKELKGDTGPLVYPAGFVYFYTAFYYITSKGSNIHLAQYIFLFIYIVQLYLTYEIYKKTCKIPAYALVLSALTSYRIHSIYVLRLFNDPIAVLFFYISLNLFLKDKWKLGSVFYSLAVSIKMNILLYAPCLLTAYLTNLTITETIANLSICALVQLFLGAPFLYGNFISYIKGSFDLGRIFEHKWTVNYRFLDRETFENRYFHLGLLSLHIFILLVFLPSVIRYLSSYAKLNFVIKDLKNQVIATDSKTKTKKKQKKVEEKSDENLTVEQQAFLNSFEKQISGGTGRRKRTVQNDRSTKTQGTIERDKQEEKTIKEEKSLVNFSKVTQLFVLPFFVTNLIGIACARSLHYQFYSWYFHSLLYLVHATPFRKPVIFLILGVIEFCWNTYPSTELSSGLLHLCHVVLLYGLYKTMSS